jgi:hypothetical protein
MHKLLVIVWKEMKMAPQQAASLRECQAGVHFRLAFAHGGVGGTAAGECAEPGSVDSFIKDGLKLASRSESA